MLKFLKPGPKKEKTESQGWRFLPLLPPNLYKTQDSVRKREDIVNPKKVTYIKFFERIKPAIYRVVEDKLFAKNSVNKIPFVLDYEYDSDLEWEYCEDAESVESTSDSEDVEEEEEIDFVDPESDASTDSRLRIPSISFPVLDVEILHDYRDELNKPLFRHETFPEHLISKLEGEIKECKNIKSLSVAFSNEHYIKKGVVQKKIQELNDSVAL